MSWRPCLGLHQEQRQTVAVTVQRSHNAEPESVMLPSTFTVMDLLYDVGAGSGYFIRNGEVVERTEVLRPSPYPLIYTSEFKSGAQHLRSNLQPSREVVKVQPDCFGDPWRVVTPGLSVRSQCSNRECPAYCLTVYSNRGFGAFAISRERVAVQCPQCKMRAKPGDNIGFLSSRFSFVGMTDSEEDFTMEGTADSGYYTLLERQPCSWRFLEVTVTSLQ